MKDTVGKISSELLAHAHENTHSAEDQMREQLSEYEFNVGQAIAQGRQKFNSDFYVVVLTKKERLMSNVIRNYFFPRQSCPTPDYDQAVYFWKHSAQTLEFLWVVPSLDACHYITDNSLLLLKEENQLVHFVGSFKDGTLLQLAKRLNGELADSPLLEK